MRKNRAISFQSYLDCSTGGPPCSLVSLLSIAGVFLFLKPFFQQKVHDISDEIDKMTRKQKRKAENTAMILQIFCSLHTYSCFLE